MAKSEKTVVAFDLYGTLLSTESIAKKLGEHFGEEKAGTLAADWRLQQLEYTWRFNSMGHYEPFDNITRRSLEHVLKQHGLSLTSSEIDDFMAAYDSLGTFPDVSGALSELAKHQDIIMPVVFSNGTISMVGTSVKKSPDLSPHADIFADIVTVEEPKRFKPHPAVYEHLLKKVGKEGNAGDVWLVSGNPFDVVGARGMGMQAAWVDRSGKGWIDRCVDGEKGKPTVVCNGLGEVVKAVMNHAKQ